MEMIQFKTRIVNLDSRPERWAQIPEEMAKMGITDYERFKAIEGGTWGSVASHIEVLRNVPGYLLVCEDDVIFIEQAREIFNKAISQLEEFDILYLGGNVKATATRNTENTFRLTGGTHTNHAILYKEECRNEILRIYNYETDKDTSIYDHWLYLKGQAMFKTYIVSPMIAYQKPGHSDCRLGYYDYYIEMRSNEIRHMI